jgi:DNA-binding response OmpR family regulator
VRLLIIEENAIIGEDLELSALDLGFREIMRAHDEAAAIEMARANPPDLIVCDVRLGASTPGVRAVNEILRHGPAAIVFLTGLLPGNEIVVDDAGVAMLGKPFNTRGLQEAISRTTTKPAGSYIQVVIR